MFCPDTATTWTRTSEQCWYWHLAPAASEDCYCNAYQSRNQRNAPPRESTSCFGKASGTRLKEYDSEQAAAQYVLANYGNKMVPYKCEDCRYWHLSPADRQTEHSSVSCSCVDEHGSRKDGYNSKEDAQRRAEILLEEGGRRLNVYRCPDFLSVWHLTKKEPTRFVGRKSPTCRNLKGEFRMEYDTEDDGLMHAAEILEKYGREVFPYECSECLKWHLR
ncbi:MAG: hypothetical protein SGARI_005647 [Bacillariaceae sp.]